MCYFNMEIQPYFFRHRCAEVSAAKEIVIPRGRLHVWNLRGHGAALEELLERLVAGVSDLQPSLIIVDPIYKVLGGRDENSAGDIAGLLNGVERLALESGAAVAFGAHFAKGNPAAKESIDRISGSGVFARDPDSILTMTRHEEPDCFTVEATLRNFPPMEPFVVRRVHPLMERAESLDPANLKSAKPGRKPTFTVETIFSILGDRQLSFGDWSAELEHHEGMSQATFKRLLAQARREGKVEQDAERQYRRVQRAYTTSFRTREKSERADLF